MKKFRFGTMVARGLLAIFLMIIVFPFRHVQTASLNSEGVASYTSTFSGTAAPQIEIAPQSGVSGYRIGIFGADFGDVQGAVSILGESAEIIEWDSTFIYAQIPAVADGSGELIITTVDDQSVSQPFEIYTIDPVFQRTPQNRFINIMRGKTALVQNIDSGYCYRQPEGVYAEASEFLTDFDCGFDGFIGDGEVIVTIPAGESTAIRVDLEETLTGTYYFQIFGFPSWYVDWDLAPQAYQIQVSADSTDGLDGSWRTVHSETDNHRGSRLHTVEVPEGGYHWIRMNITSGAIEPRVKLKELRLYQSTNNQASDLDIMTLYGDSITEGAFYHIGPVGFSRSLSQKTASIDEMIFVPFGLIGQDATGLLDQPGVDFDIYDAFAMDNLGSMARYWGIALGSNDLVSASEVGVEGNVLAEFDERVEAMVQLLISQNKVPILARIADTNDALFGEDYLPAKKKIIGDIDRIAAQYRLIPGPDLYTPFRLNIERDNSSWYWPGDGAHQNWPGRLKIIDLWTDAFRQGTNRPTFTGESQLTATPTLTETPTSAPTPAPTENPTFTPAVSSTPMPTETPMPISTNTPSVASTSTSIPTATTIPATATRAPSISSPTPRPTQPPSTGGATEPSVYLPIVGQ